jgi:hypothetical protein
LEEQHLAEVTQELNVLSEQVKQSAHFEKTFSEIEQIIQIKDKTKRNQMLQPLLQRFKENPALAEMLSQKITEQKFEESQKNKGENKEHFLKNRRNVLITQVYGKVFLDDTILVDGIVGQQTRDVQTAVTGQGPLTQRAEQWQTKYQTFTTQQKEEKTEVKLSPLSAPASSLSSKTTLQNVNASTLVANPDLYQFVTSKEKIAITATQETQREKEAIFAVAHQLPELQSAPLHSFLHPQTNELDDEVIRAYLLSQHFTPEKIEKMLTTLHE